MHRGKAAFAAQIPGFFGGVCLMHLNEGASIFDRDGASLRDSSDQEKECRGEFAEACWHATRCCL